MPNETLPRSPGPSIWRFWTTLAWLIGLFVMWAIVGAIVVGAIAAFKGIDLSAGSAAVMARINPAVLSSTQSIAVLGPTLGMLWLAVHRARNNFAGYLALRRPSLRHAVIGVIATCALLVAMDAIERANGRPAAPDFLIQGVSGDPTIAMLLLIACSVVVTSPIAEEAVFRGFVYRGFAAGRLGPTGAVILSSLIFTALHVQYDLFGLAEVLASGLLLGIMRVVSGSTLLTMVMHALTNAVALSEAMWTVGSIG